MMKCVAIADMKLVILLECRPSMPITKCFHEFNSLETVSVPCPKGGIQGSVVRKIRH